MSDNPVKGIPELGSSDKSAAKRPHVDKMETPLAVPEIVNPEYSIWRYTDHGMKDDFVCVTINTCTGGRSVSFDVTEDGMKLIVRFVWSPAMHDPMKMFHQQIADETITVENPMLHAMASAFLNSGVTENSMPVSQWIIPLPCRVRREVSSYVMTKLTYKTTTMVHIKLTTYQHDVIIEQANRTMSLE